MDNWPIARLLDEPSIPHFWGCRRPEVHGLRTRGGFEIDMAWKDGCLLAATIKSSVGGTCRVFYAGKEITLEIRKPIASNWMGRFPTIMPKSQGFGKMGDNWFCVSVLVSHFYNWFHFNFLRLIRLVRDGE
jgi:hypothetical protein